MAKNADVRNLEPSSVNAHEQGGALPVVGAAPALAEDTAGIEPTGKAEKATAAKSEALVPWAQDKAKRGLEGMPQEGKLAYEWLPKALPPEGEREVEMLPREAE
jgi:hypothetical protein